LLEEKQHLTLKNFLSEEQTHLRTTLVSNLLKNVHANLKNYPQIELFEIGRTYTEIGQFFPAEEEKIAIIISGHKNNFTILKGILESFLSQFAEQELEFIVAKESPSFLHPNKSIQIINHENVEVGFAGIVHPLVQQNFDLNSEVAYAEINFAQLLHVHAYAKQFAPIAKFQDVEFDLSILVDEKTYADTIKAAIAKSSDLIIAIELFDIYQGDQIPQNYKALAYKIRLRSDEKTLTENDISTAQQSCITNIKKIGGTIRGYE
jgi:phenylalanyl-tRNA synthetase beta chain